jgi:rhodanese-related sulfurtransferase
MSVRRLFFLLLCGTLLPMVAFAAETPASYNYISAAALEARLIAKEPIHLVDIQVEEEFARHHITGATATFAYPVKTDAEKAKLQTVLTKLQADNAPVWWSVRAALAARPAPTTTCSARGSPLSAC